MHHPQSREERRYARTRKIAQRRRHFQAKFRDSNNIRERFSRPAWSIYFSPEIRWGRYAKWNGTCDCAMCCWSAYDDIKRRDMLQREELRFQLEAEQSTY